MSWVLNSIPHVLAGGTIILGLIELFKEWDEYENLRFPWLRRAVLVVLVLVGGLTFVSLYIESRAKEDERRRSEGDIRDLKAKVQAANDAQRDNTKLFLGSFSTMSKEISDLRAQVKTEALEKKLSSVETDLQKTQKALAPGPKAELAFSFLPFNDPGVGHPPAQPVTETTLPVDSNGSVHVEFTVLNPTEVDAADVNVNVQICAVCKYANEPQGMLRDPSAPDTIRVFNIPHLHAMQRYSPMSLDVVPPPFLSAFQAGIVYRCTTCVLHKGGSWSTVHIAGR